MNTPKSFTVQEANHALALVRPIMEDLQKAWHSLQTLKSDPNANPQVMQNWLQLIEHGLKDLQQVGCDCKDMDLGLVDFPSIYKGETVHLCWSLKDEHVMHWHPVNQGYQHRMLIDQDFLLFNGINADSLASSR
jgi:hypothetical protein